MSKQTEVPDTTNWKTADERDPNYIFAQHVADNVSFILNSVGAGEGGGGYSVDNVSHPHFNTT